MATGSILRMNLGIFWMINSIYSGKIRRLEKRLHIFITNGSGEVYFVSTADGDGIVEELGVFII